MSALLEYAPIYILVQNILRGRRFYEEFVSRYVRPERDRKVLDIGCGPGVLLPYLPDVQYVGVDLHAPYIQWANRWHGHRGRFLCKSVDSPDLELGSYDIVVGTGLLHHLDDETAVTMLRLARRCLRPGGRFVIIDGCRVPGQSLLARLLLFLDRGCHVRSVEHYRRLIDPIFDEVVCSVRHDMFRVPYSVVVFECTA